MSNLKRPEYLTISIGSFFTPLPSLPALRPHMGLMVLKTKQQQKTLVVELKHGSEHGRLEQGRMFKEANLG